MPLLSKRGRVCGGQEADIDKNMREQAVSVDEIHQAISQNRLIRFHYYEWTPQKEMYLRRDGKAYEISPWGLTWDDGNYYMVGL